MSVQHLYELDRSSSQFPNQLDELLRSGQWTKDVEVLLEDEAKGLISYLQEVRSVLTPQIMSRSESSDP